jgi:hypothetical protein
MGKAIISLILLLTSVAPVFAAGSEDLRENAPDTYTVIRGDTLWGISGRFLKEPWRWPEIWKMNQEQIKNPHLIYPGDVIVLDRSGRDVQLRVSRAETVRLAPKVRVEQLGPRAVPTISPADIEPFLSKPLVVGANELDSAARIVATDEDRVALGAGDVAYAEGLTKEQGVAWQIYRRGDPLVDPDSDQILGYLAIYVGEARVRQFGNVSKVEIVKSEREVTSGDRLLPASKELPTFAYVPRAPQKPVKGRIVSTYGSLLETGPRSIVALSRGSADGLEVGHVLAIYRVQPGARYALRTSPLYGRSGPSGDDSPRPYYSEQITPRDASLYPQRQKITELDLAKFPSERYGLLMVFRTFDHASFALIMEASRQVSVNDVVANP